MKRREYKYVWDELYLRCNSCWEWKDSSCYYKWRLYKFWLSTNCKKCVSDWHRKDYENNRDKIADRNKDYYWNNKQKVREYKSEYYSNTKKQKAYKDFMTEKLWFNRHTFHVKAFDYVNEHSLRPERCSICGSCGAVEMHHPSYKKYECWSEVVFCCRSCHRQIHSWRIDCPAPIDLLKLTNNHECTR